MRKSKVSWEVISDFFILFIFLFSPTFDHLTLFLTEYNVLKAEHEYDASRWYLTAFHHHQSHETEYRVLLWKRVAIRVAVVLTLKLFSHGGCGCHWVS